MKEEEKLAVELLAHKDSVQAALARAASNLAEAKAEAAYWRGRYCKVTATGAADFERRILENRLPWE
jgi:hypothetical protein